MKSFVRFVLLTLATAGGLSAETPEEADHRGMTVTTNFTDLGKSLATVSARDPVHYQIITRGFVELGGSLAADNGPSREEFLRLVCQTVAREGYLPADEENPADIVLGITWGSLRNRPESCGIFAVQGPLALLWRPSSAPNPIFGWSEVLEPFDLEGRQKILNLAHHDVYVLVISAYDWRAAYRGEQVLLWQTRMAYPARGFSATDALTRALQAARPMIGRPQTSPRWISLAEVEREFQAFMLHNPTVALPLDFAKLIVHDYGSRR